MAKLRAGVIGCGAICDIYIGNLKENFSNVEIVSCSDLYPEKALETQRRYALPRAYSTEEMLADPEVDIILNLTVPDAHYALNKRILEAGKHIYCEKPLAMTVEEAQEILHMAQARGLRVSDAPDTFLGPGIQTCRKILDQGLLGEIIGFSANLVSPGHESWHPSPLFYYQRGGGPMRDMGPYYLTALVSLLGPVEELSCYTKIAYPSRMVKGSAVKVEVPTHYAGLMKLRGGVFGNINMSFDVWNSELPRIEVYGTKGMLSVPDPNMFGGPVRLLLADEFSAELEKAGSPPEKLGLLYGPRKQEFFRETALAYEGGENMRGLAVAEMSAAIAAGRPHRASGELACHIVDILNSLEASADENRIIKLSTSCERPAPFYDEARCWATPWKDLAGIR